jgi:hypothetical protein
MYDFTILLVFVEYIIQGFNIQSQIPNEINVSRIYTEK